MIGIHGSGVLGSLVVVSSPSPHRPGSSPIQSHPVQVLRFMILFIWGCLWWWRLHRITGGYVLYSRSAWLRYHLLTMRLYQNFKKSTKVEPIKVFVKAAKLGDWWGNNLYRRIDQPSAGLFSTRWVRTSTGLSSSTSSAKWASDLSTKLPSRTKTTMQVEVYQTFKNCPFVSNAFQLKIGV